MLTRRNFFVILIMFLVVFIMFMLVDISAGYLTRREYNPQADVPVTITRDKAFSASLLNMDDQSEPGDSAPPSAVTSIDNNPIIAILTDDPAGETAQVMQEWCVYTRHRFQMYHELPDAALLKDCRALFFDMTITPEHLPLLQSYAQAGYSMVFPSLPGYQELQAAPELADFFGISGYQMESLPLKGVYIFDDFFLGGDRIYALDDDFGQTDEGVLTAVPYYTLRPGYLLFAQAIAEDTSIDYKDLPGILWRTRTMNANVFVANTDLFSGKPLLGLLTAFMSQNENFFVYPIVNAQTISVLDFPLLANENESALHTLYSRSAEAIGRDVVWPSVVMILRNYQAQPSFFMAPQLDYQDGTQPAQTFIPFYRQEIERLSGAMGLSLHQVSSLSTEQLNAQNAAFLSQAMPQYRFTAACVTADQMKELSAAPLSAPLENITLLMCEADAAQPLLSFVNDKTIAVAFTTDGFTHETQDDLRLLSLETALGMNNQKVELSKVFYPQNNQDWNALSLLWSSGDTYQKPFRFFDAVTVYGLEERVRTFLQLDFNAVANENTITLTLENGASDGYFILRVFNKNIESVTGGSFEKLSDTAYLLHLTEPQMQVSFTSAHTITDAPSTYLEVNLK